MYPLTDSHIVVVRVNYQDHFFQKKIHFVNDSGSGEILPTFILLMNSSNNSSNPEMIAADNPKVSFSFEPVHFEFKHETCPHQKELFVKW